MNFFLPKRETYGPLPIAPVVINYLAEYESYVELLEGRDGIRFQQTNRNRKYEKLKAMEDLRFGCPRMLRDTLVSVDTPESAGLFLVSCGPWLPPVGMEDVQVITWEDFKVWRDHFTERQLGNLGLNSLSLPGMTDIFTGALMLSSQRRRNPRVGRMYGEMMFQAIDDASEPTTEDAFVIECECAVEAISALIETERRAKIKYRKCERKNCPNILFRAGSRDDQRFCDKTCRKAEESRRGREKKAKALKVSKRSRAKGI